MPLRRITNTRNRGHCHGIIGNIWSSARFFHMMQIFWRYKRCGSATHAFTYSIINPYFKRNDCVSILNDNIFCLVLRCKLSITMNGMFPNWKKLGMRVYSCRRAKCFSLASTTILFYCLNLWMILNFENFSKNKK